MTNYNPKQIVVHEIWGKKLNFNLYEFNMSDTIVNPKLYTELESKIKGQHTPLVDSLLLFPRHKDTKNFGACSSNMP